MNPTALDSWPFPMTVHTSRIIHLTPRDAEVAFGASEGMLAHGSPARGGGFRLDLPGGQAVLRAAPLDGRSRGTRRRLVGELRSRHGWVTVPVELEVCPHSDTRSELGLRPVGAICLRSRVAYRLFVRLGPALLDALALEVEIRGLVEAPGDGASRRVAARHVTA